MTKNAWQQRSGQELKIDLINLNYNCGKRITRPTTRMGIMNQEYNNWLNNKLNLHESAHHLVTAVENIKFSKCIINYATYIHHCEEFTKKAYQRYYPKHDTCKKLNRKVFQNLDKIYWSMFSLNLFTTSFHETKNSKEKNREYIMMPCMTEIFDHTQLVYKKIIENNIEINKKQEWDERYTYGLHALCDLHNIKDINPHSLNILSNEFKKNGLLKFADKNFLYKKLKNLKKRFINIKIASDSVKY